MTTRSSDQIEAFLASRRMRPRWGEVPAALRPRDVAEAYRLQRMVHERMEAAGQRRVGYKVGCTAPSSRAPFGLTEPIYAGIFEQTRLPDLDLGRVLQLVAPSIECEIAVRMARDLPAEDAVDEDAVLATIAEARAAVEVVDSRYGVPPAEIGVPTLIVDDFFHAAFVLGEPARIDPNELRGPAARMRIGALVNDTPVPGTLPPLSAVLWLARKLGDGGAMLRAGEIVLTGSVLPPMAVAGHDEIAMAIRGLGGLRSSRPAPPRNTTDPADTALSARTQQ